MTTAEPSRRSLQRAADCIARAAGPGLVTVCREQLHARAYEVGTGGAVAHLYAATVTIRPGRSWRNFRGGAVYRDLRLTRWSTTADQPTAADWTRLRADLPAILAATVRRLHEGPPARTPEQIVLREQVLYNGLRDALGQRLLDEVWPGVAPSGAGRGVPAGARTVSAAGQPAGGTPALAARIRGRLGRPSAHR
jgi:hypothetical protein